MAKTGIVTETWKSSSLVDYLRGKERADNQSTPDALGYIYTILTRDICASHGLPSAHSTATSLCPRKGNPAGIWGLSPYPRSLTHMQPHESHTSSHLQWSAPEPYGFSLLPRIKPSSPWHVKSLSSFPSGNPAVDAC